MAEAVAKSSECLVALVSDSTISFQEFLCFRTFEGMLPVGARIS